MLTFKANDKAKFNNTKKNAMNRIISKKCFLSADSVAPERLDLTIKQSPKPENMPKGIKNRNLLKTYSPEAKRMGMQLVKAQQISRRDIEDL